MKKTLFIISLLSTSTYLFSQENIIWATKLVDANPKFAYLNTEAEFVIGLPTYMPQMKLEKNHDAYTEGFKLDPDLKVKKNSITVGFKRIVIAKQIVIGGIFNQGVIQAINIVGDDNLEKNVYKFDSKTPFQEGKNSNFKVVFAQTKVVSVQIIINHSKIKDWNLIKGIGLSPDEKPLSLEPNLLVGATEITEKIQVGENISSKDCFEFNPKLTPDGKKLYFVKECKDHTDQDIWYSEMDENKQWGPAQKAAEPLNNKGHNFVASISLDGRFMILGNTYNADGTSAGDGVSIVHKKEDGSWDQPQSIKIPDLKNINDHANFFMSADEKVIIMALEDNLSAGGLDLYASFYDTYLKIWSPPMNLGTTINTVTAEDYPYLSPDGKTLYFSSKGYIGFGGHDIYVSKRLDDTWKNWSKPQNLGGMVNSKADDKGFAITSSGDHAYYNTVNFGSDLHHMDIFKINLPKSLAQQPQILVSGMIKDTSGAILQGTIKVINSKGEVINEARTNPKTGKYMMSAIHGENFEITAEVPKYFINKSTINLTEELKNLEMTKDFKLIAYLDSGYTTVLQNSIFETNLLKLKDSEKQKLDVIIENLIQQPNTQFEIGGHTDNAGKPDKKNMLALAKTKVVSDYFVSKGIRDSRIKLKSYADTKPVAENKTPQGRAKNNRITITYLTRILE